VPVFKGFPKARQGGIKISVWEVSSKVDRSVADLKYEPKVRYKCTVRKIQLS
jgi:hypothetical protein